MRGWSKLVWRQYLTWLSKSDFLWYEWLCDFGAMGSNSRPLTCSLKKKHYEHNIKTELINQRNPMFLDSRFPSFCFNNPKCSVFSKIVFILVFKSVAPKRNLEWGPECMYITILEYKKYYHCHIGPIQTFGAKFLWSSFLVIHCAHERGLLSVKSGLIIFNNTLKNY